MRTLPFRLASTAGAAAVGLMSIGAAYDAARPDYDLWRSGWAILAYVCLGIAVVLIVFAFEDALRRAPLVRRLWPLSSDLSAQFDFRDVYLEAAIQNDGETMRDAVLLLLVPRSCGPAVRAQFTGKSMIANGERGESQESLVGDGEPSLTYTEKNLHIAGGGITTRYYFHVGHEPGTYPVRLRLYDDSARPRKLVHDGRFTIPPRHADPDRQRFTVKREKSRLLGNRLLFVAALGRGYYCWPVGEGPDVDSDTHAQIIVRGHIDPVGNWPGLEEALAEAYSEARRIRDLVGTGSLELSDSDDEGQPVTWTYQDLRAADRAEGALAATLQALVKLDLIERSLPQ